MGICGGSESNPQEQPNQEEKIEYKKLLLLGAGWSGKSTVFKQMKVLFGDGFGQEEREGLRWTIYQNVYMAMKALCEENKDGKFGENDEKLHDIYEELRNFEDDGDSGVLGVDLGSKIKTLWADPAIKATYEHRTEFFFSNDEVHYFFNQIDRVMQPTYVPTEEDVLRCRWISSGVKSETFEVDAIACELFDVGGQKSERKKWVNCFENVYIVLFVVAISEYDQMMYEDEDSNRVQDALDLFDDICNSKWFCNTNVVLLLNKIDLFKEKVKVVPLEKYFSEFNPDSSKDLAEEGMQFLKNEFESRNHQDRPVVARLTCATDTDIIRETFNETVRKILIENR